MRRYEALGRKGRREFLSTLAMLAGAAPLAAQELVPRTPRTTFPPQHSPKVMEPVNVHEIAGDRGEERQPGGLRLRVWRRGRRCDAARATSRRFAARRCGGA